ncbi:MAG TPA: PRC-barrel domain-containing protein [Gemmatirosa sp.]|nr:PRC-barrel domain-containing protein [Gemmatirosa sp.]
MATNDRITTTGRDATSKADALVHSKELDGFRLPDGDPDPRGWDVRSADGRKLGKVHDLLVESGSARVRYLEVAVDKDVAKNGGREWALIPIGTARLDDDNDDVIVGIPAAQLAGCPDYTRGVRLDRTQERAVRDWARTSGHGATLGAAGATAGTAGGTAAHHGVMDRVGDKLDDLKDRVDGNPASRPGPDATDRPERLDDHDADFYGSPEYDDRSFFARRRGLRSATGATGVTGATGLAGSGAADRATNSGPLDRAADKLDDLKDRVDGNPASRPGPDPTDRRI